MIDAEILKSIASQSDQVRTLLLAFVDRKLLAKSEIFENNRAMTVSEQPN
jgi:hypothetical protein